MTIAVVAEKPSVARSIAEVLGATRREEGLLRGNGYVVTWAIGHLVGLAEPHQIDPAWKAWRYDRLPMLPREWPLEIFEQTKDHFAVVKRVLNSAEVERVVCATDAGREGELIFRYLYRKAGCRKPVQRLWVSSLTADAISAGFKALRPAKDFDALADAAEGRSRADWLVGMNFSRAYTLCHGPDLLSVGRVQTPTLAMIVERDRAIRDFVPEKYCEVEAAFGEGLQRYRGTWVDAAKLTKQGEEAARRLPPDRVLAEQIRKRCEARNGKVLESTGTDKSLPPPLLYDLTELQRHANRLYGMTAQATLAAAQSLYEQHKLLSYPRTDSRHLSASVGSGLTPIVAAISGPYSSAIAAGTGQRPLSKRYVDDAKVTDHHAIIPTGASAAEKQLNRDEERLYDLVCRRLLMAWHADHKTRVTKVVTAVPAQREPGGPVDLFLSSGTVVTQVGWKALDVDLRKPAKKGSREEAEPNLPEGLAPGQVRPVTAVEIQDKQTSPPKHHTDATLLTAMESAGKALDSRELEEAMRERGLGTPATRAAILETLLTRQYVERQGKSLTATARGEALVDVVHESVKSPQLTGEWEFALKKIERGQGSLGKLMEDIEKFVVEVIGGLRQTTPRPPPAEPEGATRSARPRPGGGHGTAAPLLESRGDEQSDGGAKSSDRIGNGNQRSPPPAPLEGAGGRVANGDLGQILHDHFGHRSFRAGQEEVCKAVTAGGDALLVMPTGAGKSLCYQLPGIARGGTTLVISPLIALMEDQTTKLRDLGFRAEAIHSGRSREQSRAACRAWLDGSLDFLMIAPERLSVPGFPEMLARRKPTLIAVDEAHCISHWGHDFRPDYRLLGERLPQLLPAPVIALTATATVRVQDDILAQLGLAQAQRFIRGFRRDNLAIEIVERSQGDRVDAALEALRPSERRPAIVYVPSRKKAEDAAAELSRYFKAAPYHAGLDAQTRSRTQEAFQRGEVEVIVATIAFGMGIDKADIRTVIHLGLPGTVEGYYQEIGRAGRDGKPARALLFWSWGDRMLHERFLERDYPDVSVLEKLLAQVPAEGIDRTRLLVECGVDAETAEQALDKLWIQGGVAIDGDDSVRRGKQGWQAGYRTIKAYRHAQLDEVVGFAQSTGCRMARLVRHFGDTNDDAPCGLCDGCRPQGCVGRRFRPATATELELAGKVLEELQRKGGLATGTLLRNLAPTGAIERRDFERLIDALQRSGEVALTDDVFEKDGQKIRFRRAARKAGSRGPLDGRLTFDDDAPSEAGHKDRTKRSRRQRRERATPAAAELPVDPVVEQRLREWRGKLAKAKKVPAFTILHDKTLKAIAGAKPTSPAALLRIKGIGPKLAEKHGAEILGIVRG
ncbi:MAG TPA: DNA topoisomerase 3 [Myxococcales bacterium]|jgi:DNA topoisomerase-3